MRRYWCRQCDVYFVEHHVGEKIAERTHCPRCGTILIVVEKGKAHRGRA